MEFSQNSSLCKHQIWHGKGKTDSLKKYYIKDVLYKVREELISTPSVQYYNNGKVIPLQARCGPEGG